METKLIQVELFTIPQAACDSGKANWTHVGQMVSKQLQIRFGKSIEFKHIEFMSEQWFENEKAQNLLEKGDISFPFVLVDGELACSDKKVNVSKVNRMLQHKLK